MTKFVIGLILLYNRMLDGAYFLKGVFIMCNNKHLSLDDRLTIQCNLCLGKSFKYIGNLINKDCTTISKEVRNHY